MVTESTISLSPASRHRWGVFWLSVIFVPWRLLGSFFWAYLRGVPGSRRGYVGVAPATWGSAQDLGPSFCPWGALWFSVVLIPWRLLCSVVFGYSWGVFILLFPFFSSSWGVFLLLLSLWDYGGEGIFFLAAYFWGLCFFGHSSVCHS